MVIICVLTNLNPLLQMLNKPLDMRSKLYIHKALIQCLLEINVLCTFNIGRASTGNRSSKYVETNKISHEKECIWQYYKATSKSILNQTVVYMLNVKRRNTAEKCEIFSKLTITKPEQGQWPRSGVFIVNLKHILQHFLVFLLFNLNK